MAAATDQVHQTLVVVGVGNTELHPVWIGGGVEQPKTRMRHFLAYLQYPLDRSTAAFNDRAHALFLDRRKASGKIARTHRVLANALAVLQGLLIGALDILSCLLCCRPG
ncbi:hypothetical protein SDC9_186259 [bioreactor metagenome]|uniref:Uncharacterized protein n=1 Tax=bioreactor metagenome TaxID=1076179 RepID=A0A645HRG8_9ZZZZ